MNHFCSSQGTGRLTDSSGLQAKGIEQAIADSGVAELLQEVIPPVDIRKIALYLGATSVGITDLPFSGVLLPSEDSFRILVNKHHNVVRQRFSVAHEVAHVLLNPGCVAMRQSPTLHSDELEKRCESLAALLLMPDPAFSDFSQQNRAGIERIIELARLFVTSIQATAIRYVDVVKEKCVLIVSEVQQNADPRLRVRWSHQNTRKYDGRSLYFVPNGIPMRVRTAQDAHRTNRIETGTEKLNLGGLRIRAYTESRSFGLRDYRYVLTLVLPDR